MSPESNKNRCGPDVASYFALGVKQQLHSLKTRQVWQVHGVKTDGCFSSGDPLRLALLFFLFLIFFPLKHTHAHIIL